MRECIGALAAVRRRQLGNGTGAEADQVEPDARETGRLGRATVRGAPLTEDS